ncbi:MAG: hypothetical protein LBJ41_05030 [Treponema sp.]|jgi:hypothetical protein|nr:hypothetical protein [Treponema sp.]
MAYKDWIPSRELDVIELCLKWKAVLEDPVKVAAYGWDPTALAVVLAMIGGFLAAYESYRMDDSSVNRIAKNKAKEKCIDEMRDFANSSVRFNKKMEEVDKVQLGISSRKTTITHHPTPTARPDIVVENTRSHFEHRILALNPNNRKTSKPDDVYGVRYGWQVGGDKPTSGDYLPKAKFNRRTSLILAYTEADKGKTVYYAICYENGRGDQGPWSSIEEALIG